MPRKADFHNFFIPSKKWTAAQLINRNKMNEEESESYFIEDFKRDSGVVPTIEQIQEYGELIKGSFYVPEIDSYNKAISKEVFWGWIIGRARDVAGSGDYIYDGRLEFPLIGYKFNSRHEQQHSLEERLQLEKNPTLRDALVKELKQWVEEGSGVWFDEKFEIDLLKVVNDELVIQLRPDFFVGNGLVLKLRAKAIVNRKPFLPTRVIGELDNFFMPSEFLIGPYVLPFKEEHTKDEQCVEAACVSASKKLQFTLYNFSDHLTKKGIERQPFINEGQFSVRIIRELRHELCVKTSDQSGCKHKKRISPSDDFLAGLAKEFLAWLKEKGGEWIFPENHPIDKIILKDQSVIMLLALQPAEA